MRIRMAYAKEEEAKFIAHLDLARVFERAMRRAGIAMAYSEGFNPHPKISFGSALAVGVEGEREYLDVEVLSELELGEILGRLQEQLPKGIRILEGKIVDGHAKALMAVLNEAAYRIRVPMALPVTQERLDEAVQAWLGRESIDYVRYSKKGVTEKDIRPWVKKLEGKIQGDEVAFTLEVEIGNAGTVRPEEVIASLRELENLPLDLENLTIKRTGIYVKHQGKACSPFDHSSAS